MPRARLLAALALVTATLLAITSCSGSGGSSHGLHLVHAGELTIATGSPAQAPWFSGGDPANGQGFESAVAYAVAARLGFSSGKVRWVTVPRERAVAAGPKSFDFAIDQISITEQRRQAVDLSGGYYTASQAVVALKTSRFARVRTLAGLRDAKLGAATGTPAMDAITRDIAPVQEPVAFTDVNEAKDALENGPIDGIAVDLPTALSLTRELGDAFVVGRLPASGPAQQYGLALAKDNPLVGDVDRALAELRSTGQLSRLADQWLGSGATTTDLR
ncbi:Periplasmic component of amino acid ABC-type transporter/signal transduction system [Frankia canadensis]|uniref:Periplasmic component of amino acid ABC-type transporter/signal transduction system n=1 Tax=Frankia canadensis TaxID=1836972 RepID=A0A2I2L2M6_9ACTN|nr:ABC transporter substrate-binding protein [Frankia canadensis]SNQ52158.1 Periplasmic component of amino acid ABC-type transporter/signal transduction system [Frankia canadensis]SOU59448.1 Periplasmic component of amino acid ABC-type transporter/signal transduction system [Frankia canadensis]